MQCRSPFRRAILSAIVGILLGASAQAHSPAQQAIASADAGAEQQFLRPFAVAGEIVDEHANPAPGITVTILSHAGEAITDELGRYIIDTRIPLDADSISLVASLPDERTGQRITTHTASIEHDDPFLDAGVLTMRSDECEPQWVEGLFCPDGLDDPVNAAITWDDGTGEALYVAGSFVAAGCTVVNRIAKWDGTSWTPLESGLNGNVFALTVFDDGAGGGPALYAGGRFTQAGGSPANRIARWDGTQWSALGSGLNGTSGLTRVNALTVFDDGSGAGPALYAGGYFTEAGGSPANRIAKWDGSAWSPLGGGVNNTVRALTVFDDGSGSGPALYAGGGFSQAGGSPASRIARWDGSAWSTLGSGMNLPATVHALSVFDDGTGEALYAGGTFTQAGGSPASRIARWDGAQWSALDSGIDGNFPSVRTLTVFDDGTGPALYAGGDFTTAGGVPANLIARWDGTQWSSLAAPESQGLDSLVPTLLALTVFDDGTGEALYVGGDIRFAGDVQANRIAKWDGAQWAALGTGGSQGVIGAAVAALTVFDDGAGSGPALYAGGVFNAVGNVPANNIARWDGSQWSALGPPESQGVDAPGYPTVLALTVFDDGTGEALYVGGRFSTAGGAPANRIAKWDGTQWSALGSPENQGVSSWVWDFAVFDDGTGEALYVVGDFRFAGGVEVNHIAKWNGSNWSALSGPSGTGLTANFGPASVHAVTVFDDGTGPALYAAGLFNAAGGVPANNIARWDGSEWSALGSPGSEGLLGIEPRVWALTVFDDGTGETLHAGGDFTSAGGEPANKIAKWDGTEWSALGPLASQGVSNTIRALTALDDGTGPALYAGGYFTLAGGVEVNRIAKWDGTQWSALGTPGQQGVDWSGSPAVVAIEIFEDGNGNGIAIYAGGQFSTAGGVASSHIAKWQFCPDITPAPCPGDITGDGTVGLDDFAILAGNFGAGPGATLAQGDLNGDGFVNLDDFAILAVNFGNDCN